MTFAGVTLESLNLSEINIEGLEVPEEGTIGFSGQKDSENGKSLIFDSRNGQILDFSVIQLTTDYMSLVKLALFDERDEYRRFIDRDAEVTIELGFHNGAVAEVFKGKIYKIGRQPPTTTIIHAINELQALKKQSGSSVSTAGKGAPSQVISSSTEVTETVEGYAAVGTGTNSVLSTIESQTEVRVTNLSNAQTLLTTITGTLDESGPEDTIIVLSPDFAEKIQLNEEGGDVRVEVLSHNTENNERFLDQSVNNENIEIDFTAYQGDPLKRIQELAANQSNSATENAVRQAFGNQIVKDNSSSLRFETNNNIKLSETGAIQVEESLLKHLGDLSKLYGNSLVAEGDTIKEVAPGQGKSTGVILDYKTNPQVFITRPTVTKKTRFYQHLTSLGSGIALTGFNVMDKAKVGGVVVTPDNNPQPHPTGTIEVPEWDSINLSDPIIPGGIYTWADATKNGYSIPEGKHIMEGIIEIAQHIEKFTKEVGEGKWEVTSWYRDAAYNARVRGAVNSYHMTGKAVDCWFPSYMSFFNSMYDSWFGGLAEGGRAGAFMHIDTGERGRWTY